VDSRLLPLPKKKTHAFACMGTAFKQLFNAERIELELVSWWPKGKAATRGRRHVYGWNEGPIPIPVQSPSPKASWRHVWNDANMLAMALIRRSWRSRRWWTAIRDDDPLRDCGPGNGGSGNGGCRAGCDGCGSPVLSTTDRMGTYDWMWGMGCGCLRVAVSSAFMR